MVNHSYLLSINEGANKHYRSSYSGISEGKGILASNIISLCSIYPNLSEEVNLYPLNDVLGEELAMAVTQNINNIAVQATQQQSVKMNR